ncbi:MAG: cytoplasmic protein [Myxococcales bacterium]|nr:MAG: cytoplasmic protein [Myxococcales bacterium]
MAQPLQALSRRLLRSTLVAAALLTVASCWRAARAAEPPDPLRTDGDKYHLVLENTFVRVLRYHDEPGAATRPHHHPCFLLYALGPFERELTFADGARRTRTFEAGETAWMPPQSHAGRNVGRTPTDALLIELKGPCS